MSYRGVIHVTLILFCGFCSACAQVKPWERGNLARSEMAWQPNPLNSVIEDHIYHSKEGSAGGASTAGGGCGCN